MEKQVFFAHVRSKSAIELAAHYLNASQVVAFDSKENYQNFIQLVIAEVGPSDKVAVVGTGNWKYSLNPYKSFKAFDEHSDIDVVVISENQFKDTWEELRRVERTTWGQLSTSARDSIKYAGGNVYSGFVTPAWIPGDKNPFRFSYDLMLNKLSNQSPGQREVKIMYFKNEIEALDYYQRGFRIAKRSI